MSVEGEGNVPPETPPINTRRLVVQRGQLKGTITRFENFLSNMENTKDLLEQLMSRLELVKPALNQFNSIQEELEVANDAFLEDGEREDFEKRYYEVISAAQALIKTHTPPTPTHGTAGEATPITPVTRHAELTPRVQLPMLEVPKFSGNYRDWVPFRERFTGVIHNVTHLSNIQKYYYLQSYLCGDARKVIESLSIAEDTYQIAWDLLKQRYENNRLIVQNHLQAIFNIPAILKGNAANLRNLLDTVNSNINALKILKRETDKWDDVLIFLLTNKVDFVTKREWESTLTTTAMPTMKELTTFLQVRCQMLESLETSSKYSNAPSTSGRAPSRGVSNVVIKNGKKCPVCQGVHPVYKCPEFLRLDIARRIAKVTEINLCKICLNLGHSDNTCTFKTCRHCNLRHNSLLHAVSETVPTPNPIVTPTPIVGTSMAAKIQWPQVILPTAMVKVYDVDGREHQCKALLDSGSQVNIISAKTCDRLKLLLKPANFSITGVSSSAAQSHRTARVKIWSNNNTTFNVELSCFVLPTISDMSSAPMVDISQISIPSHMKLADPQFYEEREIDILIGSQVFWDLLMIGQYKLGPNKPALQKTPFGWVVSGVCPTLSPKKGICHFTTGLSTLERHVAEFLDVEHMCSDTKISSSSEEEQCEKIFQETTRREADGRLVVRLPFHTNPPQLGSSVKIAERRFQALENKLSKNDTLRTEYRKFMTEYLELGHMEPIGDLSSHANFDKGYYIPHHAVFNENSTTTRCRVVFDASCNTSNGKSLNDFMLKGPTIQDDLFSHLVRFRGHKIVLKADITKMYRQILVNSEDCDYQKILWRDNPDLPVKVFRLNTVTYGTKSAPFLAVRALQQLAHDQLHAYPDACKVILRNFYVDDLLTGVNSEEEAIRLRDEVSSILAKGGLELRKWASNAPNLFETQNKDATLPGSLDKGETKTLGLRWAVQNDGLYYSDNSIKIKKITKRGILSAIAQLFDPLGLIGPILIQAKIVLQKLWSIKLSWDESVPQEVHQRFIDFIANLRQLNTLRIPRRVVSIGSPSEFEIHGFCDASELAYGACIYLRATNPAGQVSVHLLCAKSRVAPLKTITLPRLELCGAVLLIRLIKKVREALEIKIDSQHLWTDSTIVLSWLAAPPQTWTTFVANRVAEIQLASKGHEWSHISGKNNPADIISRGTSVEKLRGSTLWFRGPEALSRTAGSWAENENESFIESHQIPERKHLRCLHIKVVVHEKIKQLMSRYSSFTKLIRAVAYLQKYIEYLRNKAVTEKQLTVANLRDATDKIIEITQKDSFSNEVHDLIIGSEVSRSSKLKNLCPFVDEKGLLRVGGRLANAAINHGKRYPLVLPKSHPITTLIIRHYHLTNLHAGSQATLNSIRQRYWPLSGRSATRHVVRQCVPCFRAKPVSCTELMGALPAARVVPSRPFINCGVDYAGPMQIKESKGRGRRSIKAYVALFICMATKAVHLELVSDLTTEGFMNALKRFIARRGIVSNIYSDNGTNFVGANKELQVLRTMFQSAKFENSIIKTLAAEQIQFHFMPPRAPHHGGLWEAGIKSAKFHLKRIVGNDIFTFEEMYTFLTQIEACLNSRPLTPLSNDPSDLNVLTPGHFLIGEPLTSPAEPDITELKVPRLSRWQHIEHMRQHFWRRWSQEYLSQLHPRSKWSQTADTRKPIIGALVVVKEDNMPPLRWTLGRIGEVHPGKDGRVRVVSVKTKGGPIKRAVQKVCVLPVEQ